MRVFFCLTAILLCAANVFSQTPKRVKNVTGMVYRYENFPAKIIETRNVDVWLPPDYDKNSKRKYPVLYMQDGQNLFDPDDAANDVDWGVDETLDRLIKEKKVREAIVVGVWFTQYRVIEYAPSKPFTIKNQSAATTNAARISSDEYLKFLVEELKPFIDKTYRTLPNGKNTFLMGSSMGALISLYAVSEYPEVFGGAACLSTQFPLGKGVMLDYMEKFLPSPKTHRIYFDYGTKELDADFEKYQNRADELMRFNGYEPNKNWMTRKFNGDDHTVNSWRKRVDVPLLFLLKR